MEYNFSSLSHADFEDLARDLVGRRLGIAFEAFGAGPDDGMDGRHIAGSRLTVLQAKHYAGSSFRNLQSTMKRERIKIDRLNPARYILATSQSLTPPRKDILVEIIGAAICKTSDIFGRDELNALLREYPDIERSHIKLWLSSSAVLEQIIRSTSLNYTAVSQAEIHNKVKIYAPNPSFQHAQENLESNHVLIISGPPGVGKSTLAEMLSYAYIGRGWQFSAIRSLDDGFASIQDKHRQIFFSTIF
nr:hypothetical protein [Geminicoccus flavidas]